MIFVTGDIHSKPFPRLNTNSFYEQKNTKQEEDFVIICGDFGLVWDKDGESPYEKHNLDDLEKRPFTTLFCDGNHENFDRLDAYPVEEWHGGKVHKIRPHVIHLMRGQIYDICGKSFFVFGGARSHDIRDGVLEKDDPRLPKWQKDIFKMFRINHVSWWEQEMPSKSEMLEGLKNLESHDSKVDFIITHEMPTECLTLYCALHKSAGFYKPDELNDYLEGIRTSVEYSKWFCGHYHESKQITEKDIVVLDQIIRIV